MSSRNDSVYFHYVDTLLTFIVKFRVSKKEARLNLDGARNDLPQTFLKYRAQSPDEDDVIFTTDIDE